MPGSGGIDFAWQTATETGTLGFNIYAHDGSGGKGGWQRINDELIPSMTGDSVSTREYSYQASYVTSERFMLGDVDRNGYETRHGPFELGNTHGVDRAARTKTNWKAIRAESKGKSTARKQQLRLHSQARLERTLNGRLDAEEMLQRGQAGGATVVKEKPAPLLKTGKRSAPSPFGRIEQMPEQSGEKQPEEPESGNAERTKKSGFYKKNGRLFFQ